MVGVEAEIVMRRRNGYFVTESMLMQACIGSVLNPKEGGKQYNAMIRKLNRG